MTETLRGPNFGDFINIDDGEEHVVPPPHVNIPSWEGRHQDYHAVDGD